MAKAKRVSAFRQALEKIEETKETKEKSESIIEISLKDISNPQFHDRSIVSKEDILDLANNIKEVGLLNPVLVRKKGASKYERISGYRRIEAARSLNWKKIKAIVVDVDDKVALLMMLSENIQRENLNPYDEVVAMLQLMSVNLDLNEENVKSILYKVKNFLSGNIKELTTEESDSKETIDGILSKTGKYNFQGFINRLRVLNLNPLIIDAMRIKKLNYTNAVEINKLKDSEVIEEIIEKVVIQKMTKEEVKTLVKSITGKKDSSSKDNPFKDLSKKYKTFSKLSAKNQNLIKKRIDEINKILAEV